MKITNKYLGDRIREARKKLGRTQKELAEVLGKTAGAISQLEQGNVQVSVIELDKIADFLNKPIEYFFGEEYIGEDVQALIAVIRKMPPEIRQEQVAIIQSLLFMQEISDEIESKDDISDEDLVKEAKNALGNLNLYLAAIRNMWDQAQVAKNQLEEVIGIEDMELK